MIIGTRAKPKAPPVEPGTYLAVCVGIYELGEQQTEFKNKTRYSNQIMFTFEIPAKTIEVDGEIKPRQLSRTFAVSASKKGNLRKFLGSWTGTAFTDDAFAAFDTDTLLGSAAMIQVVLNDTGEYANIDGIMRIPEGLPAPQTATVPVSFDIEAWDDEKFDALPEWVQEKIKKSAQYQKRHAPETEVDFPAEPKPAAAAPPVQTVPPAPAYQAEEECPI
ncbi:MAG: hypothetical protein LUF86_02705 [Clostridiales bacterium]|nr:hypothetical protein [Clostridiales bacterium]